MRKSISFGLLVWSVTVTTARGAPADLLPVTPRDVMAAVLVDVVSSESSTPDDAAQAPHGAAGWLSQLRSAGMTPAAGTVGVIVDAATTLSILRQFPFAIVLTDVAAEPRGDVSYQLADLQIALIVKTGGRNAELTHHIQNMLSTWTTTDTARVERIESNGDNVFTLVDSRWPSWLTIRWGKLGDCYVVAMGNDAFESASRTIAGNAPSLANDARFAKRLAAVTQPSAKVEWLFDAKRLYDALHPTMPLRVDAAYAALDINPSERMIGSIGKEDRATTASVLHARGDAEKVVRVAIPVAEAGSLAKAIPDEATSCAVIARPIEPLVRHVVQSYLSSRRESVRDQLRERWADFEQTCKVDLHEDILGKLSPAFVIHNYPENPLGIAFFVTIICEIKESPAQVHGAIDAMLTECAKRLNAPPADSSDLPRNLLAPSLHRDADGIWYLQAGIYGPSLAVVDRWIVISFSPYAVRQNVALLSGEKAKEEKAAP